MGRRGCHHRRFGGWLHALSGRSETDIAFAAYEEPETENPAWRTRRRMEIIRSRCWIYQANGPVFAYLGDHLGNDETVTLSNAGTTLDKYLKDRERFAYAGQDWWINR